MEEKKKTAPYTEASSHGDGQKITVRPGNFTPPPARDGEKQGENKGKNRDNRGRAPRGGEKSREGGEERKPQGKNHRPRNDRRGEKPASGEPQGAKAPRGDRRGDRKDGGNKPQGEKNRSERRGERRDNREKPQTEKNRGGENAGRSKNPRNMEKREKRGGKEKEPRLSDSLKKELDADFGILSLSPIRDEKEALSSAVDTKEFEVDIASAAYLVEDIPCGFPVPDGKAVEVVGVRFRHAGKVYFFAPGKERFLIGDNAIVDTARGPEFGEIVMLNRKIAEKDIIQPLRPVLRRATAEDVAHNEENHKKEAEALKICAKKIEHHKLEMKLVDAQYAFDNSKLLFYFTSDGRVDFRELVRDLAGVFRTRIELRQIGIRDESRLIGGLGMCGRPFCCTTFLSDFGQVSVKMAKEQGLSINTSKISGCCGRLMCCLRYEHETYAAEAALTPEKGARVETPDGMGTVVESLPLSGTVKVKMDETPDETPTVYHRDKVKKLPKEQKNREEKSRGKKEEKPQTAENAPAENPEEQPLEAVTENAPFSTAEDADETL